MPAIKFNAPAAMDHGIFQTRVPEEWHQAVEEFLQQQYMKGSVCHVEITRPKRSRSTGYRSQNSRFRGHCEDIARQLTDEDGLEIYPAHTIAEALKRMATDEGYPWRISLDGKREPYSTAEVTLEEMKILLDVQQRFADESSLYLTEYDEKGIPYRSIGGRSREEMEACR